MASDRIEASKILVWGQIGDDLKKKSPRRMFAIAQDNPNYSLGVVALSEIRRIRDKLKSINHRVTPEIVEMVAETNEHDDLFREIATFLQASDDMLSVGSFMMGETEKKTAIMKLLEGEKDD